MNWDYSSHYARFHPDTMEHDASLRVLLLRWLGPHLPTDKTVAVLDVGCGRGYALKLLRELGYQNVAGIDLDAGQVAFARQHGLDVEQVAETPEFLRGRPERYDLVLLMDVLEHVAVEEQPALLAAIHASLRRGGRLICTVPNAASPLAAFWRYADFTHRCVFTTYSLEFVLTQTGFRVAPIGPVEFFARPRFLFWLPSRRTLQWTLLRLSRIRPRLACIAELGPERGWRVPLSPNLLACAFKD